MGVIGRRAAIGHQRIRHGQDRLARLTSFSAFRFLYERLIGAEVRPWLPSLFCAAAALPHLHPELRRQLLQSISEAAATAAGWSSRQPAFFPHWVEKVDTNGTSLAWNAVRSAAAALG